MNPFISKKEYEKAKKTVADYELWNHPLSVEARKLLGLNQFCDELCWDNSGLTDDMSVRLMNSLRHFEKIKVCDLTRKQFLSVKGNGQKTWVEFCDITGKNVSK